MTVTSTTPTPTGTSSTTSSTAADLASGQSQLNTTYTSFLTLLTAQLQNQDPLSPMDTNTFTQQLVAMNGVQQQLLTNNLLQQLVTQDTGPSSVGSAVSLIGKEVTSSSNVAALQNGTATWNYSLPATATTGTAEILNSSGTVVWTGTLPSLTAGSNTLTWNGGITGGGTAPAGNYTLNITAAGSTGQSLTATTSIQGVVSGVQTSSGATQVVINGIPVNYSTVTAVTNPS